MLQPDSLADDLYRYLIDHMYASEGRVGWVMNAEWNHECRKLSLKLGYYPPPRFDDPEIMLGLPILAIRDNGGVPHLEPID